MPSRSHIEAVISVPDVCAAIESLRRIRIAVATGNPPPAQDIAHFVASLLRYEAQAAQGMTLDRALGLKPGTGGTSWWAAEQVKRRDEKIRALRARCFADLHITHAAAEIAKLALRYQTTRGRHDRMQGTIAAPNNEAIALVAEALDTGQTFPRARQVENILRNETGLLVSERNCDTDDDIRHRGST